MNKTAPFNHDLAAQPIGWPCVIIGPDGGEYLICHYADGTVNGIPDDWQLLLSLDFADPAVRLACKRAADAGHEIWAGRAKAPSGFVRLNVNPSWVWHACNYLPACIVESLGLDKPGIAPGWNPKQLTLADVGPNYRLVAVDEGCGKPHSRRWFQAVELYSDSSWGESRNNEGAVWEQATYRTRLTREELAALDMPAWQMPTPPPGRKWHRSDFAEADLPDGYRPLMDGEQIEPGDEREMNHGHGQWTAQLDPIHLPCGLNSKFSKRRTRRPLLNAESPEVITYSPDNFKPSPESPKQPFANIKTTPWITL